MAYNFKKYAKFGVSEAVLFNGEVYKVAQSFLDLVNDIWLYRLSNLTGWYSEKDLNAVSEEIQ